MRLRHLALAAALAALPALASAQQKVLRIAMTASDVPTTNGMPNNGSEGMRFLGFPIFEPLVDWDLSRADRPADIRPGLAESWAQDAADGRTWRFNLRKSNTEPVVRLNVESRVDQALMTEKTEELLALIDG